jgi:hypothetical protein
MHVTSVEVSSRKEEEEVVEEEEEEEVVEEGGRGRGRRRQRNKGLFKAKLWQGKCGGGGSRRPRDGVEL